MEITKNIIKFLHKRNNFIKKKKSSCSRHIFYFLLSRFSHKILILFFAGSHWRGTQWGKLQIYPYSISLFNFDPMFLKTKLKFLSEFSPLLICVLKNFSVKKFYTNYLIQCLSDCVNDFNVNFYKLIMRLVKNINPEFPKS